MAEQVTPGITATETCNIELWAYCAKLNRYIKELNQCNSANDSDISEPDRQRFASYSLDGKDFLAMAAKLPEVDVPKTGTIVLRLPKPPTINYVENDQSNLLVQWLEVMRDEMMNSESSRRPVGLKRFDFDRAMSYWQRYDDILAYSAKTEPRDYVESSPREDIVPLGELGVQPSAQQVYNERLGYPVKQ
jgi:hypothetical protein